jgi:hypothetical protein
MASSGPYIGVWRTWHTPARKAQRKYECPVVGCKKIKYDTIVPRCSDHHVLMVLPR